MCDEERPRMTAARLEALAASRLAALRVDGRLLRPVVNATRKLAAHFWGQAWMKHLSRCEAGGLNLAPGRTLLRHGCVLDLQWEAGKVTALVSAEELYEVTLRLSPLEEEKKESLRAACSGRIDSLVSLLEGRVDDAVLTPLCDPENGLLPDPADWHMGCTCPDWSEPCPHAAATIYALGTLIDADPSLLFQLRDIDPAALLAAPEEEPEAFNAAALSRAFGIELDCDIGQP